MRYYLVGLGNAIDRIYEGTRHNVGLDALLYCAYARGADFSYQKKISSFEAQDPKLKHIRYVYFSSYMNCTGQYLMNFCRYYRIDFKQILVWHDDMHLPVGKVGICTSRSSAGHNGIKSILELRELNDLQRCRIGIGSSHKIVSLKTYVLEKYSSYEQKIYQQNVFPKLNNLLEALNQSYKDFTDAYARIVWL